MDIKVYFTKEKFDFDKDIKVVLALMDIFPNQIVDVVINGVHYEDIVKIYL